MKPEELLRQYVNTCEMCTDLNCDDCAVEVAIDTLEKTIANRSLQKRKHEYSELFGVIPAEEINRVFSESKTAIADMDYTFLCFEDQYKALSELIPKDWTVIDIGCAYAPQSYYFKDHKRYIGVDISLPDVYFDRCENATFVEEDGCVFCNTVKRCGIYKDKTFAICNYVPNDDVRDAVRKTFKNCFVYYPER